MKPSAERVRSMLYYKSYEKHAPFVWQSWLGESMGEDTSGLTADGYLQINIDGTFYRADELAWLIMTGEWPEHEIIHADSEKLNNSWDNIKEKAPLFKAA